MVTVRICTASWLHPEGIPTAMALASAVGKSGQCGTTGRGMGSMDGNGSAYGYEEIYPITVPVRAVTGESTGVTAPRYSRRTIIGAPSLSHDRMNQTERPITLPAGGMLLRRPA